MISVVIVNWNAGRQLLICVKSVVSSSNGLIDKIVVVDNGSTDDSLEQIGEIECVEIVRAEENLGFGRACNLGVSRCNSDYILLLNPDAEVFERTFDCLRVYLSSEMPQSVGVVGIQLVDGYGHIARSCTRFPGPLAFIAGALGADRLFPKLGHFMVEWPHDESRVVDHVIGAFYLMRRDVFNALGGFDERFFLYLEDLDLSLRAKKAGWDTVFLANVQAFHAGGGTSCQIKAKRLFYATRSKLQYAFKHFSLAGALMVLFATLLLELLVRTVHAAVRGSVGALRETWSAWGMLFRWLPKWLFRGGLR
jgi:GT2 family glycosyltransferase